MLCYEKLIKQAILIYHDPLLFNILKFSFGVFTTLQPSWKYANQADILIYNNTTFFKFVISLVLPSI